MKRFIENLSTVLNEEKPAVLPVVVDIILVNIRTILCNKILSKELRRVLVEVIAPLAKVSAGLCSVKKLEELLEPANTRLLSVSKENLSLPVNSVLVEVSLLFV